MSDNTIQSPWMTVPEAARYARSGRNRVYDACRTGELTARQSGRGGTWLIHRDAIDAWLAVPTNQMPSIRSARRRSA